MVVPKVSGRPFDTSILDAALERRRTDQEQRRRALLSQTLRLLDEWGPRYHIGRAYIFGSVTRPGRFTPDSDIDIAVEPMAAESFFTVMSLLAAALGHEVDMIELDKCHFAHRIREEGIEWTKAL